MLGWVLVLQVVHESVPLAFHVGLVQVGESLQALGGDDRVPVLRGVDQPHVGEAARAVSQRAIFTRVLQVIGGDHVTSATLRVWFERGVKGGRGVEECEKSGTSTHAFIRSCTTPRTHATAQMHSQRQTVEENGMKGRKREKWDEMLDLLQQKRAQERVSAPCRAIDLRFSRKEGTKEK